MVQGPVEIGNSLTNGRGATLARVFLRLSGLPEVGGLDVPVELYLSSSLAVVEPTTCSTPSETPCPQEGSGLAGVTGYPTSNTAGIYRLKLAAAHYLPPELPAGLAGSALEVAFEGAITIDREPQPGHAALLRLLFGQVPRLLAWGADNSRAPEARPYDNNTGAGLLLGDTRALLFPGTAEAEVVENNGNTLVLKLTKLDIDVLDGNLENSEVGIAPDPLAAERAGLPAGSFGLLEINYSGSPTLSRVFPGAASNDVELSITAIPGVLQGPAFIRGDCNADGAVSGSVTDAIFLLNHGFLGGPAPRCRAACDVDGDGTAFGQVTDAVYLMTFNFLSGPPPPAPYPKCGATLKSAFACASYPPCE